VTSADLLRAVLDDPGRVEALSPAQAAALLAELGALVAAVARRVAVPDGPELLTAAEVAERMGLTTRQVYRRADRWPFTRHLSAGTLRFDRRGLEQYLGRRA